MKGEKIREGYYEHKCLTCENFFIAKGKIVLECQECKIKRLEKQLEEQKELVEFSKAIKFAYEQYDEPDVQNIDGKYEIWISKEKQWCQLVDWYRQQKEGK